MAITHPDLAAQWHPTKNGDLAPSDVVVGTTKRIWWKCPRGPDHEWQASGHNRVGGSGCPACSGHQVSVTNSLASYPALAEQWHPTNNGDLTPADVTAGSDKKFWWKCPVGPDHEWQASCGSRTNLGSGCPFCNGKRASATNNMAVTHPQLAAEWHPTKNGDLLPTDVVAGTGKKFWWLCAADGHHVWKATGASRIRGPVVKACPSCANRSPTEFNNMAVTHPDLAAEWHPTKNGDLRPEDVIASTTRQIWWQCSKDSRHEWRTSGGKRVQRAYGCPSCSNQRLDDTNCMAATHPELAAEWHPTKNGELSPTEVIAGTRSRIWWQCQVTADHAWCATGNSRVTKNSGCPYCAGRIIDHTNNMAVTHPELAAEWHPTKNGALTPSDVVAGARRKFWWICSRNGEHEWETSGDNRVRVGTGCPSCGAYGFKPSEEAWLYLLEHSVWQLQQLGITNEPEVRLATHARSGWEVVDITGPMNGDLALAWEQSILIAIRSYEIKPSPNSLGGKFNGYTESWPRNALRVTTLRDMMDLVEDGEASVEP